MSEESRPERKRRKRQEASSNVCAGVNPKSVTIKVNRSGDWMPVEDLRDTLLDAIREGCDLSIDLDGLSHLDASALQILLAAQAEQRGRNRRLELQNASPEVRAWFDYAGAAKHLLC